MKRRVQKNMKKSKLSVGLVASFIGALALSACGESTPAVTTKKGSLVELVDYNSEKIEIKTDDLYSKISESSDGRRIYYNAVLEALIRYEYPKLSSELNLSMKSYDSIKKEAEDKIKSSKETANDNASANGTSYDEEWEKILESNDCETEKDLLQHFIYDLEKEELSDWYAKSNIDTLKDEYLGVDKYWNLIAEKDQEVVDRVGDSEPLYPYHILHVLVTLSADKDDYSRGTITEAEATKLWTVVRDLIDGTYSFEQVAYNLSDDTGSKAKYGDVGIMSTKTSFYNEFKLGIYAYDALLSGVNTNQAGKTDKIYEAFGLADDATIVTETTSFSVKEENVVDVVKDEMATNVVTPVTANIAAVNRTIPMVPYSVFKKIAEVAKDDKIGALSPEAGDVALPRNVLYNQFLNFHSPFLITSDDIADNGKIDDDKVELNAHDFSDTTPGNFYIKNANFFKVMKINGVDKKVLTDRDGNVIIGVRSESGIHFMLMRKSIFKATNEDVSTGTDTTKANQSLQDYYTTLIPSDADFPTGETYVKMVEYTQNESYYKDRVDEIKNALKSSDFDAAYDYRLYDYLLNNDLVKGRITFADSKVKDNIDEYIKLLRESKTSSDERSINESWQSYLLMLRYQNYQRSLDGALMPTTCAFRFNDAHKADFEKGGDCYVNQ